MVKKFLAYLSDSYQELRRVIWPTRREVISHTFSIAAIVIVTIIALGIIDYGLTTLLKRAILNEG